MCLGISLRRFAYVARPAGFAGVQDRPSACEGANAHDEAETWPQDLSVSAARYGDHAAEPGLGDGHHLHPDGAWLRLSRCRAGLGDPPGSVLGLSITMEAAFCVETLEDALARHGKPGIFNTDQGSQFTGAAFTGLLAYCSPSAPLRQIEGLHEGRVSGSS